MMYRKNFSFFLLFLLLSFQISIGQEINCEEKKQKQEILVRNNYSDSIRPEYILNIKLKRKPNSRKVEIISMRYEKRQSRIFKMLLAQKEKIVTLEEKEKNQKK